MTQHSTGAAGRWRLHWRRGARQVFLAAAVSWSAGCSGLQSALAPASQEAERIAALTWWLTAGALVVWVAMVILGLYYGRPHEGAASRRRDRLLIGVGGVAIPLVVLTTVLIYGLRMLPPLVARAPEGSLVVEVDGEQWWWRVRYRGPAGAVTELANEIRLPLDAPVQFQLRSDNVIHSFWIPALGGKMDMIPGRTNYLTVHPSRVGTYAGVCAEYCGTSHAFMRLMVQVVPRAEFDRWLLAQAAPARPPAGDQARRGYEVLLANGCAACHRVRGTPADGEIGPDLTHVGGRLSLAAGTLPTDQAAMIRWLNAPDRVKPGVHMPAFAMIGEADVAALAAYLRGLQ